MYQQYRGKGGRGKGGIVSALKAGRGVLSGAPEARRALIGAGLAAGAGGAFMAGRASK